MNTATKLGLYGLVLAASLGGGLGLGSLVGPIDASPTPINATHASGSDPSHTEEDGTMPSTNVDSSTAALPAGGLLVTEDGFSFQPEDRLADAGTFAFTIVDPGGAPLRSLENLHGSQLHLIVASADLRSYAHVHPERDDAGRWTVTLPELPAGPYRAFADFKPAGHRQLTLGIDLLVPGLLKEPPPLATSTTDTVDKFEVQLLTAPADDGVGTEAVVTVRRGAEVVRTEPYLGAAGHLVALRDGDLAYLHVHPLDEAPNGPVRFAVEVPGPGTYALFFDFQVDGVVRNARFVVNLSPTEPVTDPAGTGGDHNNHS